jgi:hypothetical protein
MTRPALWLLLLICAVVNMVASLAELNVLINITSGLGLVACAAGLIRHHYRHRRPSGGGGAPGPRSQTGSVAGTRAVRDVARQAGHRSRP